MPERNLAHHGIALAKAWLHDPPSKALGIQGHEARTRRLLEIVVGADEALRAVEMTKDDDVFAAITERLPMPSAGPGGERAVKPADGLVFVHPLSGKHRPLETAQLDPKIEEEVVSEIIAQAGDSAWVRFLALWRCLPERLAAHHPDWALLPADTRQPDHTIFHHLDTAAAFETAGPGAPLLSFSIGPVQSFIASARTLRDLWSGSLLLSKLTFAAMRPVLDAVGPQAFVYPSPRGIPDVDVWLLDHGVPEALVRRPDLESRLLPAIPNRFLAIVPAGGAADLAEHCESAVRRTWGQIASDVQAKIHDRLGGEQGWDARWREQIESFWEIRTSLLPRVNLNDELRSQLLGGLPENVDQIRRLADVIPADHRYGFEQKHVGRWAADVALSARIAEAAREVAHFRADPAPGEVPAKCTLLGELEQMGPPGLGASRDFWDASRPKLRIDGLRLREGERLSAVGLVRRFWPAAALGRLLGTEVWSEDTRIADTATVAARIWLRAASIDPRKWRDWNGTWLFDDGPGEEDEPECPADLRAKLHEARRDLGKAPPRYFAVLHMDGDHLGRWLRGELAPTIREALHPKTRQYFESLGDDARNILDLKRPLSPTRHAALSEALLRFARDLVPSIIEHHSGELVYAGGDDVIALLPLETAFACADKLRSAYSRDFDEGTAAFYMGSTATMSGGVAVVHHRGSLRGALEAARQAEKSAKSSGRNALGIAILRRSGEHAECVAPWTVVPAFVELAKSFEAGATVRWAYRLRSELDALEGLPHGGFVAELGRLIARTDREAGSSQVHGEIMALLARYADWARTRAGMPEPEVRKGFCTLVQSAAFVARGGDR